MNVLGIDIGSNETSGAVFRRNLLSGRAELMSACLKKTKRIIPTTVVLTNEQMRRLAGNKMPSKSEIEELGEISFGNDLPNEIQNGEKFTHFNVHPKEFNEVCATTEVGRKCGITYGMVMACYMCALVKSIFSSNPLVFTADDIQYTPLVLGCPAEADWADEGERKKYAALIRKATGIRVVDIVFEPIAAVLGADVGKKKENDGLIILDFGSFTARCAYTAPEKGLVGFSRAFGAALIEREMTMDVLEQAQGEQKFDVEVSSFIKCEESMKRVKELYYDGHYAEGCDMVCAFKTEENESVKQFVTIDDTFMNHIVNEREITVLWDGRMLKTGAWAELCRDFLWEAKEAAEKDEAEVKAVLLTGGASKMGFVCDLCSGAFCGKELLIAKNPEDAIAKGLAWYGQSKYNL